MPRAPKKPCARPGCPALVDRGHRYCQAHERARKAEVDARRAGPDRGFYGTPAWRRLRAIVLREEPLCCCGCGQRSDTVDHHEDRRQRPDLALVRSNLRAFAARCHNRRTASESGGFGNPAR